MSEPEPTFEQAQAELERIVEQLERGQVPLDEAIALWERGEQLHAFCRAKLVALSPVQTLERGYAIVRTDSGEVVTSTTGVSTGARVDVTLAEGGFGARVEEVAP